MISILPLMLCLSTLLPPGPEDTLPPFAPRTYVCYRADAPLVIDGKLDEPSWVKAAFSQPFVDIEGEDKPEPLYPTRMKMLWDDDYFYFSAKLEEPHVWAKLTQRDCVIYHDNDFEIFIDPDGDTHHYYELEMNALNTVWDLFLDKPYRDGCKPLFCWDIQGLKTGVHVMGSLNDPVDEDEGWTVEVAMPWAVLKECAPGNRPPRAGEQWRVNFSRVEWRVKVEDGAYVKEINPETGKAFPENNWVWSPQGVIAMHQPETWGFVQFSQHLAGKGEDRFVMKEEELAKWALRQVYYRQVKHHEEKGSFARSIEELGLIGCKVPGFDWPPRLECTSSYFEARLDRSSGEEGWHIRGDGRVWKSGSGGE